MNPQLRAELTANMIRLADGDRQAFEPIFAATWPLAHRLAVRTLGATEEAEDAAQCALMKVFSRATEFRSDGDALSWILGITAYECKTSRQKVRHRRESVGDDQSIQQQLDERVDAEGELLGQSMKATLRSLLGELSPRDQEAILASIEEMAKPDIAPATFRKRLERAMGRLRDKWSDHDR